MSEGALDARIAQQAAEWFLLLQSGEASADDRAAFERWRIGDPQCEHAWRKAELIGAKIGSIPANVGMPALRSRPIDRRAALKALGVLIAVPTSAWLSYRQLQWQSWTADYRTDIGEQRDFVLPDNSHVWLNTDSAVDIAYDHGERRVHLRSGEFLVQTAPDPASAPRPFIVETRDGRIRALGTRFIVRRLDDATAVTVIEHAVEITPNGSSDSTIIEAGSSTHFNAIAVNPATPASANADAWSLGVIFADGMRLDDFIAELGRYRPGVVRCDPEVAGLKVSGAFQIRNTDPVLRSLARALPVRVVYRTPWWVSVGAG